MQRNFPTPRAIQLCLIFVVLVVVGSLLYSWYVRRSTSTEVARTKQAVQHLKNPTRISTETTAPVEFSNPGFSETPKEHSDTETSEAPEALEKNETEKEIAQAGTFETNDSVSEEEDTGDVQVSPFGFGPYPEVPPGYPRKLGPSWLYTNFFANTPTHELRDRVLIQLWNQGETNISGAFSKDGLVYPLYPDHVYIKYEDVDLPDGTIGKSIRLVYGDLPHGFRLIQPPGEFLLRVPDGITALDLDTSGINPHDFLELR